MVKKNVSFHRKLFKNISITAHSKSKTRRCLSSRCEQLHKLYSLLMKSQCTILMYNRNTGNNIRTFLFPEQLFYMLNYEPRKVGLYYVMFVSKA